MMKQNDTARAPRRPWLAAAAAALALSGVAVSVTQTRAADERLQSQSAEVARSAPQTGAAAAAAVTIKNFGRVNENYYRGAQPGPEEFAELKRLGVKTVIDLRKDSRREAPEWVRAAGLKYVNLPLMSSRPATEAETEQFLKLVNDPENWPVYVHCKGGRHRTGALTAVFRITHDGWTADRAFEEMLKYDFNNGSIFGGGDGRARQKKFVYDFYARHAAGGERSSAAPR
jgi:protein tyrosine/serine phosphatase